MAAVAVLVAASCSGGDDSDADVVSPTTTEAIPVVAPLTGLEVDTALERPALVVKIDNNDGRARPQAGLAEADIVFEELVEGSITRFAAVYHSTDAAAIGPVRSGRSTDIEIVASFNDPLFAFSGANDTFLAMIRSGPLVDAGVGVAPEAYERRPERRAPEDLFTSTGLLWALPVADGPPPEPQFAYSADAPGTSDARPIEGISVRFGSGGVLVTHEWDEERAGWARRQGGGAGGGASEPTPHVDEEDLVVAPQNVVVLFVDYEDTGIRDSAGALVPEARLVDAAGGAAWILTAEQLVEGRWSRSDLDQPAALTDVAGDPVSLRPGTTWVLLLPTDAEATIVESAAAVGDGGE
ncbi:MAG: DUF3048 domain-containing protein [Acidimicrobiia bacterium]|nr:DUF3048 domain-containing protein [Acidimicrobiia bacterium]